MINYILKMKNHNHKKINEVFSWKIKDELGLMPQIDSEEYEKTLEEVFSKLDKF